MALIQGLMKNFIQMVHLHYKVRLAGTMLGARDIFKTKNRLTDYAVLTSG